MEKFLSEEKKEEYLNSAVEICKQNNVLLPKFKQLADPNLIPQSIKDEIKKVDINLVSPWNLWRISWLNEPKEKGLYNTLPNYVEIPPEITGIKSRILMIFGKFFPTGSHKVGASYGPLISRLITGRFDPKTHKGVWPSSGNYCRGGVFNSALIHAPSIAILPEGMSKERFDWLTEMKAEIVRTPSESSIKGVVEASDKLVKEGKGKVISFNQFADFSNPIWHYWCTGSALEKVYLKEKKPGQRLAGCHLCEGSGGTLSGSSHYLRSKYPRIKIAAGEAIQCPTLMKNGTGTHRIEGIGDAFVPWILDFKNIDAIIGLDDEDVIRVMNLFNQPAGVAYLKEKGVNEDFLSKMHLFGISSIANMLGCIKEAKMYEFNENDILVSVCTDSMDLYQSRLKEYSNGYSRDDAVATYSKCLMGQGIDNCKELIHKDKKQCHNLKYFTWIEQQEKTAKELNDQWYDDNYWDDRMSDKLVDDYDLWIDKFNEKTGLKQKYGD